MQPENSELKISRPEEKCLDDALALSICACTNKKLQAYNGNSFPHSGSIELTGRIEKNSLIVQVPC